MSSEEDVTLERKQYYTKESDEFKKKMELEGEMSNEFAKVLNTDAKNIQNLSEKYKKKLDNILQEEAPKFPEWPAEEK